MASQVQRRAGEVRDSAPDEIMRNTGISPADAVPWGTRICIFYDTKQDLLDLATSFFEAGVKSDEFCLWVIFDPITKEDAENALRRSIPELDRLLEVGQIELLLRPEWHFEAGQFDLQCHSESWNEKLNKALEQGFGGMRVTGNAFSIGTVHWKEFLKYEQEVERFIVDKNILWLCTYGLEVSRTVDLLNDEEQVWLSLPQSIDEAASLTPREDLVLSEIVRGLSNKEIALLLRISRRTVEFHRANLLKKFDAKNTADLMRKVLGQ